MRKLIVFVTFFIVLFASWGAIGNEATRFFENLKAKRPPAALDGATLQIVSEESVVIDIVEKVTPSVVTVGVERRLLEIDPFDPFGFFQRPRGTRREQDIGSGFVVSSDGLIVTNKHVVSESGKYKIVTHDGKKYDVVNIYRDPANDIAIVKINLASGSTLQPVTMGDSSKIKVGQLVVAVGTPLGEFRGSVTKGIVSGLGRGITAGSPFEGFVERLDNVIQTDAAINPGNSGGPLVNASGQVIGVNTAVASEAQNIGFAIPINVVGDALDNFQKTGGFNRGYLGVAYRLISRELAILNDLPEGAYVQEVIEGSSAQEAGIAVGDIITKIDGRKVQEGGESGLAQLIAKKKVGDTVAITLWRDGETLERKAILKSAPSE